MITEQLQLFSDGYMNKIEFSKKLCEEFNKLDTVWHGKFYVDDCRLERWYHVNLKNKVLAITYKALNQDDDNHFIYLKGDPESQNTLAGCGSDSGFISNLLDDKDFSINLTPWDIYIYYFNWERKKITYEGRIDH